MTTPATILEQLSVLLVSGPDARSFLQGQLSADMQELTPDRIVLGSCNSPQGRVQAIAWIVERPDGIALLVSRSVAESTEQRLRRYVLRSKVSLSRDTLHVGVKEEASAYDGTDPERCHRVEGEVSELRWFGHRHTLIISPNVEMPSDRAREERWRGEYLRSGFPQVYAETHERFVAQMLNLDLLGGISFTKGCYTGQEIIARTHYRGAIKRRMFRFRAECAPPLPGSRVLAGNQHAGDVVDAISTASGCELLAVVTLPQLHEALTLETTVDTTLERLTLPYDVGQTTDE